VKKKEKKKKKAKRERKSRKKFPFRNAYITVRVTEQFYREVENIGLTEGYTDIGDYVRDLIRKDFRERGITLKLEKELEAKEEAASP